jgi:hypothetical protein
MLKDKLSIHHVWLIESETDSLFFGSTGVQVQFSGCRGRCFGCESPLQVPDDIGMSPGNLVDRVLDFFAKEGDPKYVYLSGCDILSQGHEKIVEVCDRLTKETDAYVALSTSGYPIDQLQLFAAECPDVHLFVTPYTRKSGKFDFFSPKLMDILTSKDLLWIESKSCEDTLVWLSRLSSIMQSDDSPILTCGTEHRLRDVLEHLTPTQVKSSIRFTTAGCLLTD